jgi:amino acid transporter
MVIQEQVRFQNGQVVEKGLKHGALGLLSSVVIGVASTAPAYSLAATLGFVVALMATKSVGITLLAFIPMLLIAFGYKELNAAEPDCGTTFTWATKAFGPKTGWLGGWAIVAADVLVMASLAQVAGAYFFLLIGNDTIGSDPTSGWVLFVGVVWIVLMTAICYAGIEVSANFQKALLGIELAILYVFSVTALVKVYTGHGLTGSMHPSLSWLNPFGTDFSTFNQALLLMLFIYWGWDTTVSVNEETANQRRTPGVAAVVSTIVLLVTYLLVTTAAIAFAGTGTSGSGLANPANSGDVLSVLGHGAFGTSTFGNFWTKLLLLMVLSSAAASTQTTILPTARTTLSMAAYRSIPKTFARIHPRFRTPSVSTLAMGGVSIVLYVVLNYLAGGNIISDSVSALGWFIAFYYGLTGFACAWYYRRVLTRSARDLWLKGILPTLGGVLLFGALGFSIYYDWNPNFGYTYWTMPFAPHWAIGGIWLIAMGAALVGVVLLVVAMRTPSLKPFFRGEVMAPSPDLADVVRET